MSGFEVLNELLKHICSDSPDEIVKIQNMLNEELKGLDHETER